jgi:hypothetical protein
MDGMNYVDHKLPFIVAGLSVINLTTTYQNLVNFTSMPVFGPNYWQYPGKAIRVRAIGLSTTGATPGTLTFSFLYGPATPGSGTTLAGVSVTWTASQTNMTFIAELQVRCRTLIGGGFQGNLLAAGRMLLQGTGLFALPPTGLAVQTVDFAQPFCIVPQASRSGSTAESLTVQEIMYEALN